MAVAEFDARARREQQRKLDADVAAAAVMAQGLKRIPAPDAEAVGGYDAEFGAVPGAEEVDAAIQAAEQPAANEVAPALEQPPATPPAASSSAPAPATAPKPKRTKRKRL